MKSLLGAAVFLVSLLIMRQILVGGGVLTPLGALFFLASAVGIPLGGIVFLEGAFDFENREIRRELDSVRREVADLKRRLDADEGGP